MTRNDEIKNAWAAAQDLISQEMPKSKYVSMIKPLTIQGYSEDIITIQAPATDIDWLNARVATVASHHITGILGEPYDVIFTSNGEAKEINKDLSSGRKAQLAQAYGDKRAAIIQPHKSLYISGYYWENWRPLLGKSTADVVIACRSLCYWNPQTGELRNRVTTDREEIARIAGCSTASVDRALNHKMVRQYFVRKKIARIMTETGIRNHGLILRVRMDDPLTPEDQKKYKINEPITWSESTKD